MFNFPSQVNKNGTTQTLSISFGDRPHIDIVNLLLYFQINYFIKYL